MSARVDGGRLREGAQTVGAVHAGVLARAGEPAGGDVAHRLHHQAAEVGSRVPGFPWQGWDGREAVFCTIHTTRVKSLDFNQGP